MYISDSQVGEKTIERGLKTPNSSAQQLLSSNFGKRMVRDPAGIEPVVALHILVNADHVLIGAAGLHLRRR